MLVMLNSNGNTTNNGAIATDGGVATKSVFNFTYVGNKNADTTKEGNKSKKIIGVILSLIAFALVVAALFALYSICGKDCFSLILTFFISAFDFLGNFF